MTTISIDRRALARTLSLGSTIVTKSDIDVLNNVLLSFARGQASLVFTDLELWATRALSAVCDTITATTISASLLTRAAGDMEGDTLVMKLSDGMAVITAGRSRLRLHTLPSDQFPNPAADFGDDEGMVRAGDLAAALQAVAYAAERGPGRYVEGVHINASESTAVDLAAFDGRRIAIGWAKGLGAEIDAINLPIKACRILEQMCREDEDANVRFRATDRIAEFRVGPWTLRSKLIEAQFAPYGKIVDGFPEVFGAVDRGELERALKRLALVSYKEAVSTKVDLQPDRIILSLASNRTGDAVEEVLTDYDGPQRVVGFNLNYLRDAVGHVQAETIHFGIDSEMRAFVRAAVEGGRSSIHSIQNMAIKETAHVA